MRRILLRVLGAVMVAIVVLAGSYTLWYFNRPLPKSITMKPLFDGITYTRAVRTHPHPHIIHIATIDLTDPDISFLVTPPDDIPDYQHRARTVSEFIEDYDIHLAINADFFFPWYSHTPWDYYPHSGDGVNTRGLVYSNGTLVTEGYAESNVYRSMYVYDNNEITFEPTDSKPLQAVSGNFMLVTDGQIQPLPSKDLDSYFTKRHPRTAIGLSQNGESLMFIVVDGRQPNYSEGATIQELAAIALEFGAHNALNLDGGGSTTMAVAHKKGVKVLNSPIHTRLPGRERPVANHIGVISP